MKIKYISGRVLDTDSLPDTEAMVLEKAEQFRQFCLDNKVPFVTFIDPKGTQGNPYLVFWNFANRANNYNQETIEIGEKHMIDLVPLLSVINNFVYQCSGGEICLIKTPKD